jgi:anti-sigma factor RsiW
MTASGREAVGVGSSRKEDMEAEPIVGLNEGELADLARFFDGTLPADRRAEVAARVAASPQLAGIIERQGITVDALRATVEIGAPARLRGQVNRRRHGDPVARGGRRQVVFGGALATAAAVALALALILPGGASGGPSAADAAALSTKPPTLAAPGVVPGVPLLLRAEVDRVPFPDYAAKFGWKPVGARHDAPSGRDATTVYYRRGRRTIAYTIVSGDALDAASGTPSTRRGDIVYRTLRYEHRTVLIWERGGHTCVLSGRAVGRAELTTLADWRGGGAIPF